MAAAINAGDPPFSSTTAPSPAERDSQDRDLWLSDLAIDLACMVDWIGMGADEATLTERLASRTNSQIRRLARHLDAALKILD